MRPQTKADRWRAKLARCTDPYWCEWLRSAIAFAEWEARQVGRGPGGSGGGSGPARSATG